MLHEKLNIPKCNLVYLIQSCFFFPCRLDKASATSRRNSGLFRMGSSYRYRYNSCLMDIYGNSWKHYLFICSLLVFICFYLQNNIKYSTSACFALKNEVGYNNIVIYQEVYHLYQSTNVHVVFLYLYNVMIFSGDACY